MITMPLCIVRFEICESSNFVLFLKFKCKCAFLFSFFNRKKWIIKETQQKQTQRVQNNGADVPVT